MSTKKSCYSGLLTHFSLNSKYIMGAAITMACIKLGNFMLYRPGYATWLISMTVNDVIIKSDVRVVDLDLRCYLAIIGVTWNEC